MAKSKENFNCSVNKIHHEKLNQAKANMSSFEEINRLSEVFKALGDQTRLKIVNALLYNELCVCDLAALFEVTQSAMSHQLRVLRHLGIVHHRKDGKIVYYSINKEKIGLLKKEVEKILFMERLELL
ncbi:ArsR/SmtB family transcription factor [Candidatus Uabimicrobium amorphum]|uniref:Transcriptional regulator n=1 Tax=Uabimicrobium amorphum TaxID=2596890 RepID=A0A5S9F7B5_UABAM|nr:metalloregulator ArsR/SmtB family transcription factor [Candidatus Uabimicrobium amorphum]BBM87072.1 transcriptional regulator [Candidatus Uabimicrobium amorphum]